MRAAAPAVMEALGRAGLVAQHVHEAWAGQEHHVCKVLLGDGRAVVVKVPRPDGCRAPHWAADDTLGPLLAEAEAVSRLSSVPVAAPSRVYRGEPPFAVQPLLPGRCPEAELLAGRLDRRAVEELCVAMGRLLAGVHRLRRPRDEESGIPLMQGADPERARLLHGDFHVGNVLALRDKLGGWRLSGLVDWTCCRWGPREEDFLELGVSLFATNPWALEPFLMGYHQGSGQRLDARAIQRRLAEELGRRLEEDPPESEAIARVWEDRVRRWAAPSGRASSLG